MKTSLGVFLVLMAGSAHAVELSLPLGARQVIARDTVQDRFAAPIGAYDQGHLPSLAIEGPVARSAWRIDVADLTPLQLIAPLRTQLEDAGYRIVLDCEAQACGGYDFRFAAEVLPAPNMYVNIRSFHAVTALKGPEGEQTQAVSIIASASSGASFVQIIQAGTDVQEDAVQAVGPVPGDAQPTVVVGGAPQALIQDGHVILLGLDFESGTSELGPGPFALLEALVDTLRTNPDMRLALVGHTDNVGNLDANIALSISRAQAVRQRMVSQYGIAAARLDARGMGYLAPYTTNATAEGREINRRVEAVLLAQ